MLYIVSHRFKSETCTIKIRLNITETQLALSVEWANHKPQYITVTIVAMVMHSLYV